MQSHLTGIIPNVFTKESLFFIFTIRAEGGPHPRKGCADLDALRTFAEHPVRIQAQWSFKTKNTSMSESLYARGGGLFNISSNRIDMQKLSYLGYRIHYTYVTT